MKKINGIDTLSAQKQLEIMWWYTLSKRIIITLASALLALSFTQWYLLRHYAPSCKPCITPSYADTISKKHAKKIGCVRNKKLVATEQEHGIRLLKNYLSFIAAHINQEVSYPRLTDLRLTPQGFDAHYTAPHRAAVQNQLKDLSTNPAVCSVSLNTIEQKNNGVTSSFSGTWKETKIN